VHLIHNDAVPDSGVTASLVNDCRLYWTCLSVYKGHTHAAIDTYFDLIASVGSFAAVGSGM